MSLYPEVDMAIEDIVNEGIVPGDNMDTVKLDLDDVRVSDVVKKKIHTEFKRICNFLELDKRAHDMFRRWCIKFFFIFFVILPHYD